MTKRPPVEKPEHNPNPDQPGMVEDLLERYYRRFLIRALPMDLGSLVGPITRERIEHYRPVDQATLDKLLDAAKLLQERALKFLDGATIALITHHLSRVDFILISDYSGVPPAARLGVSQPIREGVNPIVIGLALNAPTLSHPKVEIKPERLASNLTHEIGHVADPYGNRLNFHEYSGTIQAVHHKSVEPPDPETSEALIDPREMGPRTLEGSLFGTSTMRFPKWCAIYEPVVKLVERDQLKLLQPNPLRPLLEKNLMLTTRNTFNPKSTGDTTPNNSGFACVLPYLNVRPQVSSPLEHGVAIWAREQAHQAAQDPDRAWYGALAEFEQLKAGTHPDPNPTALIMPDNPELYQRLDLNKVDDVNLKHADKTARRLNDRSDYKPDIQPIPSPQREAAICREVLDDIIRDQEDGLQRQADYDFFHPDEVPEVEVYPNMKNPHNPETSLDYQI